MKGSGDILLAGPRRSVPEPDRSEQFVGGVSVNIGANVALGTYYLIGCADNQKSIVEINESNNCGVSATQIIVTRPDLVTSSVSNPPGQTAPGRRPRCLTQ